MFAVLTALKQSDKMIIPQNFGMIFLTLYAVFFFSSFQSLHFYRYPKSSISFSVWPNSYNPSNAQRVLHVLFQLFLSFIFRAIYQWNLCWYNVLQIGEKCSYILTSFASVWISSRLISVWLNFLLWFLSHSARVRLS